MTKTIPSGESFSIISFQDNPQGSKVGSGIRPHSVMRTSDKEVFTIGDIVTNGTRMTGEITGFSLLEGEIFIEHTWSGIGMNLESLSKVITLPSQFQIGDAVWFRLWSTDLVTEVLAVHFYPGKVKYDLKVLVGSGETTRLYNIDSVYVTKTK